MRNDIFRKGFVFGIILVLLASNISFVSSEIIKYKNYSNNLLPHHNKYKKEIYIVETKDNSSVTLTRYVGTKRPSIILIHGMGSDHKFFDWDDNHSLAQFLNNDEWDVWMLDLRTHDGDGDFFCVNGSDREYINRYWDFDRTLLKIDVVTAIDFVKNKTGCNKIVLSGHSYGGYLAYAYAELIGEENLSGVITTGAAPYANPKDFQRLTHMYRYGFYLGEKAFVRPWGCPFSYTPKWKIDWSCKIWKPTANFIFYFNTTPEYIQKAITYCRDNEPAGVCVDMHFGKDPKKYHGDWVDPQTLYNYSANLYKITSPILFIAGANDPQDPSVDIYKAYENVSSTIKEYHSYPNHSHLDLLLGNDASSLIFPVITNWMNSNIAS